MDYSILVIAGKGYKSIAIKHIHFQPEPQGSRDSPWRRFVSTKEIRIPRNTYGELRFVFNYPIKKIYNEPINPDTVETETRAWRQGEKNLWQ